MEDDLRQMALDRLLEILESARENKQLYFLPVGPVAVIHWLHGLRTGLSFVGLCWLPEYRQPAVERRGIEFVVANWEDEELERRGLSPEAIADELLAIEIEMWSSQRKLYV